MIGSPRIHHRLTDSTNERGKELAIAGAPHGTLVTADEQSAGRGRQGRSWVAPPGRALLMSVVLRDLNAAMAMVPLAAAVAVAEAFPGVGTQIKWPNDVWIERRKVAGILVEGRPQEGWAVLGIGLNVATELDELPVELRETATSLRIAHAGIATPAEALAVLLPALERWLGEAPLEVLAAWRARDALAGERIAWDGGEGVAAGVDDEGSLLVDLDGGERVALRAGEVHLRRVR
jgi:BirA family biotin operon repressor/biotin-[acetyl-CoA-carboxylase] ligase